MTALMIDYSSISMPAVLPVKAEWRKLISSQFNSDWTDEDKDEAWEHFQSLYKDGKLIAAPTKVGTAKAIAYRAATVEQKAKLRKPSPSSNGSTGIAPYLLNKSKVQATKELTVGLNTLLAECDFLMESLVISPMGQQAIDQTKKRLQERAKRDGTTFVSADCPTLESICNVVITAPDRSPITLALKLDAETAESINSSYSDGDSMPSDVWKVFFYDLQNGMACLTFVG